MIIPTYRTWCIFLGLMPQQMHRGDGLIVQSIDRPPYYGGTIIVKVSHQINLPQQIHYTSYFGWYQDIIYYVLYLSSSSQSFTAISTTGLKLEIINIEIFRKKIWQGKMKAWSFQESIANALVIHVFTKCILMCLSHIDSDQQDTHVQHEYYFTYLKAKRDFHVYVSTYLNSVRKI